MTIYINQQSHLKELIIEGVVYIADGENPRSIELKLNGYINS